MGPAPDQAATLIGQGGEFDLQPSFGRSGARAEDFENQTGAIYDLAVPGPLQIALLDRTDCMIEVDQPYGCGFDDALDPLDNAFAKQGGRPQRRIAHDFVVHNFQADRPRKTKRFIKPRMRISATLARAPGREVNDGAARG